MNRVLSGLLTVTVVLALVLAGLWTMIDTYVVQANAEYLLGTLGGLAIAFGFTFGFFVLGARSDGWIRSPYW